MIDRRGRAFCRAALLVLIAGACGYTPAQPTDPVFYDFDTDQSGDWTVLLDPVDRTDFVVDWAYDYSTHVQTPPATNVPIPSAPNSTGGTTIGVRLAANLAEGSPMGISLIPSTVGPLTNYRLTFDAWANYNGNLGGATGSTEFMTYGAHWDGNYPAWVTSNDANYRATGWFAAHSGDGGSSRDHRYFTPNALGLPIESDGGISGEFGDIVNWFGTGAGSQNSTPEWQDLFPDMIGGTGSANIGPYETEGAIGKAWNTWIMEVVGRRVTISVVPSGGTETVISRHTMHENVASSGFATIGLMETFASVANPPDNFIVFDNVRIEQLPVLAAPIEFVEQPFVDMTGAGSGPDGAAAQGDTGWHFRNWTDRFAGSFVEPWLTDAEGMSDDIGAPPAFLSIMGAGDPMQVGSFAASFGEWILPGSTEARFVAGEVYSIRAEIAYLDSNLTDGARLNFQENSISSFNQSYYIYGLETVRIEGEDLDHPFYPPLGTPRNYLTQFNPRDEDLAGFNTGAPEVDRPFLAGFDVIDTIENNRFSAMTVSQFEIGSIDEIIYESNAVPNPSGGSFGGVGGAAFDGNDNPTYDGWGETTVGLIPLLLVGRIPLLRYPESNVVTAEEVRTTHVAGDAVAAPGEIDLIEFSNYSYDTRERNVGTTDLDIVEVVADAVYCAEFGVSALKGDDNLAPCFMLRTAMPIPTYSIEFQVLTNRGTAYASSDSATFPVYFTAPTQFEPGPPLLGQENDLMLAFRPINYEYTDGELALTQTRLQLLGVDDPNIDY